MKKLLLVLFLTGPLLLWASEQDEKVKRQTQDAMKYAREHSKRKELSNEDLMGLAGAAMKLLETASEDNDEQLENDSTLDNMDLMDVISDMFK